MFKIQFQTYQPKSLETQAMKKLEIWTVSQAETTILHASRLYERYPMKAKELLSRDIEISKLYLSQTPSPLYDQLAASVMQWLASWVKTNTEGIDICNCDTDFEHDCLRLRNNKIRLAPFGRKGDIKILLLVRVVEIFLTEKLLSMSLDNTTWIVFRQCISDKAHQLTGLQRLELKFDFERYQLRPSPNRIVTGMEEHIIPVLKELRSLTHLTLTKVASDPILMCIEENCKFIQELDLSDSPAIDDRSMYILLPLRQLRCINITYTYVNRRGFEIILRNSKNLESIQTIASYQFISTLAKMASENNPETFKLKYLCIEATMSLMELQLVVKICPMVRTLKYKGNSGAPHHISELKYLQELYLSNVHFYTDKIIDVLHKIGRNLLLLNLNSVDGLDLNALKQINLTCPNLETFVVVHCCFEKKLSVADQFSSVVEIPPFDNLKEIVIGNSIRDRLTDEQLIYLLSSCPNVERVSLIGKIAPKPTDAVLLKVLDSWPRKLSHLKTLWVQVPLTKPVIDYIVQNSISPPDSIGYYVYE